jgi:DNA-binding transcriptional LysR family regulator
LLIEAGLAGDGVMLGWRHLTQSHLDAGDLVAASPLTLVRERGNFLKLNRSRAAGSPHALAFVEVLLDAAKFLRERDGTTSA